MHGFAYGLPYEITEMIIAHAAHDSRTLKACALTCHSWHVAAVPHLHYTLTLMDKVPGTSRGNLEPLSKLHQQGLIPLIKEVRVQQRHGKRTWFAPQAFGRRELRYFSALANVQTLRVKHLEISLFIPGIERYFGHFSPTLRSIALFEPVCTPRQLSHFLSHFPNLENIKIWGILTHTLSVIIPDTELVPFSAPKLQGRLVLYDFDSVETWTRLIALGGGLRFRYMDLSRVGDCAPVLFEACAGTLETLRFHATDGSSGEWFSRDLSTNSS